MFTIRCMEREPHEILGVSRSAPWPEVRTAFRSLARRYHPDGSQPDAALMAAVNAAYEALEQQRHSRTSAAGVPVGPGESGTRDADLPTEPPPGSLLWRVQQARHPDSPVLDFGQYAGWSIAQVARHDPRYLVWLSRHSSGVRFRRAIELVLGSSRELGRHAAVLS